MKNHICLTFSIVSSFLNIGQSGSIESIGDKNYKNLEIVKQIRNLRGDEVSEKNIGGIHTYNDRIRHPRSYNYNDRVRYDDGMGLFERNGRILGFDEGNPDVHSKILRPCQAYDTFCIRKFFAEHSECKISGRAVPDHMYRAERTVHYGSNNMSETQINADYAGINIARISEFYINNVTDNLAIAVTFDGVSKFSNETYEKYYLRGREPVVTTDFGGIQYGVVTVTVIIPNLQNLRLDRSEIYTYGDTNLFPVALGPRIGISTDPEVPSMYASFFTTFPFEAYQEEISIQGIYFVGNYLQYNICDFGVKVL